MAEFNEQELSDMFKKFSEHLGESADSMDPVTQANREAAKSVDQLNKKYKEHAKDMADFYKQAQNGKEGVAKYADAVEGAAGTASTFANAILFATVKLNPLTAAIAGTTEAFSKMAADGVKRAGKVYEGYQDLAKAGSLTAGGLEGLQEQLNSVGLISTDVGKFQKTIQQVIPELAILGGGVQAGQARFVGTMEELLGSGLETPMRRLGYTTQDIADTTADYIAKQTKLGLAQSKTTEQLAIESANYAKTLAELQEFTGMQRDAAKKELDRQLDDFRVNMYYQKLSADNNEAGAKNLQMFISSLKDAGEDTQEGFQNLMYNEGLATTEIARQIQTSTGYQAAAILKQVKEGTLSWQDANRMTAEAMMKNQKIFSGNVNMFGDGMKNVTGTTKALNWAQKASKRGYEDNTAAINKTIRTEKDRLDKFQEMDKDQREIAIATDRRTDQIATDIGIRIAKTGVDMVHFYDKMKSKMADIFGLTTSKPYENPDTANQQGLTPEQVKRKQQLESEITKSKEETSRLEKEKSDLQGQVLAEEERNQKLQKQLNQTGMNEVSKRKQLEADIKKGQENVDVMKKKLKDQYGENLEDRKKNLERERIDKQTEIRMMDQNAKAKKQVDDLMGQTGTGATSGPGGAPFQGPGIAANANLKELSPEAKKGIDALKAAGYYITSTTGGKHAPNSDHYKGGAVDFVVPNPPKNDEEGKAYIQKLRETTLKGMNIKEIIDEYNHPSANSSGGHFHVAFRDGAAKGGLIKGPKSGYAFLGHGTELVLPNADKLMRGNMASSRTPLESVFGQTSQTDKDMVALLAEMSYKLDTVADILNSSSRTNESILQHMKA